MSQIISVLLFLIIFRRWLFPCEGFRLFLLIFLIFNWLWVIVFEVVHVDVCIELFYIVHT